MTAGIDAAEGELGNERSTQDARIVVPGSLPVRAYGLYGVWSRLGWMVVISAIVADFVWVGALTVEFFPVTRSWNPTARASQLIHQSLVQIKIEDAWAFLGVFAAIVVAIQVSAFSNHGARNSIADSRSTRFTTGALFTGAAVLLAGVSFVIALGSDGGGRLSLVLAATLAVAFFAADGASIVLRQDRREEVRLSIRRQIRSARAFGGVNSRRPYVTLFKALVTMVTWALISCWVPLGVLALVGTVAGAAMNGWWSAMISTACLALTLTAVGVLGVCAIWAAQSNETTAVRAGFLSLAGVVICFGIWAVFQIVAGAATAHQPGWVAVLAALAVALPFALPYFALLDLGTVCWVPGWGQRRARNAIARIRLARTIRSLTNLGAIFDS